MSKRLFIPTGPLGNSIHGYHLPTYLADGGRVAGPHMAATNPVRVHAALGWPTRLFEVSDAQVKRRGRRVSEFLVVEEHPGHLILGPHGREVQEVLDEAPDLVRDHASGSAVTAARDCRAYIAQLREQGLVGAVSIIEQATLGDIDRTWRALVAALALTDVVPDQNTDLAGFLPAAENTPFEEHLA